ncbi:WD repeat-containing protein 36-like [Bolinopsis microptera]|uniref:WD repeat-containing protein 36-like n=1 Tax=Bolinopsis microptera TaxID=2820187 RepID=UPI003078F2C6
MIVHDIETGEVYADMWLQSCVTAVTHPATYLNKVLLGNKDGVMELWNVRTLKLIHQFKPLGSAVTVLTQSPGIDIIGVGLKSGEILLHNLKHDETMMKFYQDWGCVTSLSFRSDGIAHMVSGSTEGHLAVWDLERQELNSTIHHAHHSTVATSHFLASQPLLFTAGDDNAIKIWVFDGPGGTARLLRERSGHRAPPTIARFYSATAENILSAGHDRSVRMFSVIKDERSKELSQGSMESKSKKINVRVEELKLSPVTALAAEEIREREWSNVITAHSGSRDVRAWSTLQGALSDKPLSPKLETIVVTAVSITVCGNIAIVGYNSGHLTAFNIQSGINRGLFGKIHAHRGKVVGVASDNINKFVISVGHDTQVKLWDLSARKECHTLSLPHSATHSTLHRDSNLLAVSLDTNTVCVVDIDTRKVVREFRHSDSVLDMCYSVDGKSLLVCSSDSTIRQWDLITARLIDCFKTHALVTSISLSKENLVTTHHNELGICLWTNRTLYENVELRPLPDDYEPRIVDLLDAEIPTDMEVEDSSAEEWKSTDQINESLITLSTVPKARWTALCKLDIIKKRNKPKAPPTGPKAVPFFLSTTRELVPKFVLEENEAEETEKMKAVR